MISPDVVQVKPQVIAHFVYTLSKTHLPFSFFCKHLESDFLLRQYAVPVVTPGGASGNGGKAAGCPLSSAAVAPGEKGGEGGFGGAGVGNDGPG